MLITAHDAPTFEQNGVTAVGYASPMRGAGEISLWRLSIAPGEATPRTRSATRRCSSPSAARPSP